MGIFSGNKKKETIEDAASPEAAFSAYSGECIILTTKHQKSAAIAPVFERVLGAGILEYVVDTDELGTFSGEIERQGSALDCVRKKCEWGMKVTRADYALASEGSFGPHPFIPFVPSNREILYFIDKKRKFNLHVTDLYMETNYQMGEFSSLDDLSVFVERAQFPSHALIVRPSPRDEQRIIFKGVENKSDLEAAFKESLKESKTGKVWLETDMRAHVNPTRMTMIGKLSKTLAERLCCLCPKCKTPGWGKIDIEVGLPCGWCGTPTEDIKAVIYGCTRCKYRQKLPAPHGKENSEPGHCPRCNP